MKHKLIEWIGKSVTVSVHQTDDEVEGVLKEVGDDHLVIMTDDDKNVTLVNMVFVTTVDLNE